jgi:tight adherence protein B
MEPVVIAILVSAAVFCVILALIPKKVMNKSTDYTKQMLQALEGDATLVAAPAAAGDSSILKGGSLTSTLVTRAFFALPGAKRLYPLMMKAGIGDQVERFFIVQLAVFALFMFMFRAHGIVGIILSLMLAYIIAIWRVKRRINARNMAFLAAFPDALDMIVRSVRSGYPLSGSIRMVAENTQAPVSTEFKQVADETSYGSNLIEALMRMTQRIDEPDVRFFVVMLTVQQDVGGNLSESLSNLSGILRKRRHLRMKIKAMTSEGRATAYVLGSMPLVTFGLIYAVRPDHLAPLFNTDTGNMMFAAALGILALGATITWRMVHPEV